MKTGQLWIFVNFKPRVRQIVKLRTALSQNNISKDVKNRMELVQHVHILFNYHVKANVEIVKDLIIN